MSTCCFSGTGNPSGLDPISIHNPLRAVGFATLILGLSRSRSQLLERIVGEARDDFAARGFGIFDPP